MVVKVTSEEDTLLIPNLKITLLDTLDNTVIIPENWSWNEWPSDTLQLWQNPPKTTHSGRINNQYPMNPWFIRFPFAQDNYVLVTWKLPGTQVKSVDHLPVWKLPGTRLKIEDIDGDKNGGHFQTVVLPIDSNHLYRLCSRDSNWQDGWMNGEDHGFVEDYQPIEVKLHKK